MASSILLTCFNVVVAKDNMIENITEVTFIEDKFFLMKTIRLQAVKESTGKHVWPTTPIYFDVTTGIMRTYDGKVYRVLSYSGNNDSIVAEIMESIKRKRYLVVL